MLTAAETAVEETAEAKKQDVVAARPQVAISLSLSPSCAPSKLSRPTDDGRASWRTHARTHGRGRTTAAC